MRKHWYFIETHYCPICGRGKAYRERRYGRKPKRWERRNRVIDLYDGCEDRGWQ